MGSVVERSLRLLLRLSLAFVRAVVRMLCVRGESEHEEA